MQRPGKPCAKPRYRTGSATWRSARTLACTSAIIESTLLFFDVETGAQTRELHQDEVNAELK